MTGPGMTAIASHVDCYDLFGATLAVSSSRMSILQGFGDSFVHFRRDGHELTADLTLEVSERRGRLFLGDGEGPAVAHRNEESVLAGLLERAAELALRRLGETGVVTVHASAVVQAGGAILMSGPCGAGKSTLALALALAGDGTGLLSDDLAPIARDGSTVLPYRRSVHVRPGTVDLVPALAFLKTQPQRRLGGGLRWAVSPEQLEQRLPGCLGEPAPLREVLLLGERTSGAPVLSPIGPGEAVVELAAGTPIVVEQMGLGLSRLGQAVSGARCARLQAGDLDQTVELIRDWVDRRGDER